MSVDFVVFLKFAAILGGLVWLNRRASGAAQADRAARAAKRDGAADER